MFEVQSFRICCVCAGEFFRTVKCITYFVKEGILQSKIKCANNKLFNLHMHRSYGCKFLLVQIQFFQILERQTH